MEQSSSWLPLLGSKKADQTASPLNGTPSESVPQYSKELRSDLGDGESVSSFSDTPTHASSMQYIHSLDASYPISCTEPAPPHVEEPKTSLIVKEDAVKMKSKNEWNKCSFPLPTLYWAVFPQPISWLWSQNRSRGHHYPPIYQAQMTNPRQRDRGTEDRSCPLRTDISGVETRVHT
jgi:hypothetical protein